MRNISLIATLLLAAQIATAGPGTGHSHANPAPAPAISESTILDSASSLISKIVSQQHEVDGQKLDESWNDISNTKIERTGTGYSVISAQNQSSKTLYLLVSDTGELFDANFSGEFKGL